MITIGQLASYAGVTIKAVRHYHQRGLLEEPPRDASGYRRYSAQHAIDLVKIKTLADAGVPLGRIKWLLAADDDEFAAATAEIDHKLEEWAEKLHRTRERIAQLRGGDRLFVSAEVADYLDRVHELGVSQRSVQMERDIWILMQSISPKERRPSGLPTSARQWAIRSSGPSTSSMTRRSTGPRRTRDSTSWRNARSGGLQSGGVASSAERALSTSRTSPGWSRRRSARRRRPGPG